MWSLGICCTSRTRCECTEAATQTGKIQQVFTKLKVSSLLVSDALRWRLVEVVRENINAFAATSINLGRTIRTSVVSHIIMTNDAKPF